MRVTGIAQRQAWLARDRDWLRSCGVPAERRAAIGETAAHLEYLLERGQVTRKTADAGTPVIYDVATAEAPT
jgi:hypothetical protein